jgi:hypothetical protein
MMQYTLNIAQVGKYDFEISIPEIGATVHGATFDGAMAYAQRAIVAHQSVKRLVLVFTDQEASPETFLEEHATMEIAELGIAPQITRRETRLIFELTQPLTPAQLAWLREHKGKLFDRFHVEDEVTEVTLEGD